MYKHISLEIGHAQTDQPNTAMHTETDTVNMFFFVLIQIDFTEKIVR